VDATKRDRRKKKNRTRLFYLVLCVAGGAFLGGVLPSVLLDREKFRYVVRSRTQEVRERETNSKIELPKGTSLLRLFFYPRAGEVSVFMNGGPRDPNEPPFARRKRGCDVFYYRMHVGEGNGDEIPIRCRFADDLCRHVRVKVTTYRRRWRGVVWQLFPEDFPASKVSPFLAATGGVFGLVLGLFLPAVLYRTFGRENSGSLRRLFWGWLGPFPVAVVLLFGRRLVTGYVCAVSPHVLGMLLGMGWIGFFVSAALRFRPEILRPALLETAPGPPPARPERMRLLTRKMWFQG